MSEVLGQVKSALLEAVPAGKFKVVGVNPDPYMASKHENVWRGVKVTYDPAAVTAQGYNENLLRELVKTVFETTGYVHSMSSVRFEKVVQVHGIDPKTNEVISQVQALIESDLSDSDLIKRVLLSLRKNLNTEGRNFVSKIIENI